VVWLAVKSEGKSNGWAKASTRKFITPILAFSKAYDENRKQEEI